MNTNLHGFTHEDLEAIAQGLDAEPQSINVGNTTGEGDELLPSTACAAAKFIRAAMAAALPHQATQQHASGLHDAIMRLPCRADPANGVTQMLGYQRGHRDARHAAAELATTSQATQFSLSAKGMTSGWTPLALWFESGGINWSELKQIVSDMIAVTQEPTKSEVECADPQPTPEYLNKPYSKNALGGLYLIWQTAIPTTPGIWWLKCYETDDVPESIPVSLGDDGTLMADDPKLGILCLQDLHDGLTSVEWAPDREIPPLSSQFDAKTPAPTSPAEALPAR